MRIEKINENVVKVFLDSEDLALRSIELSQIKNNPSEYEELIWDIVEHAEIELGTAITEGHLMVECFAGETNNLVITITKRDAPPSDQELSDPVLKKMNDHIHNTGPFGVRDILTNRRTSKLARIAKLAMRDALEDAKDEKNFAPGMPLAPFAEEDLAATLRHNDYDIVLFPKLDDLISFIRSAQSFTALGTSLYSFEQSYFLVVRVTKRALPMVNRLETKIADYNATYVPSDVFYPLLSEKGKKLIAKNAIATLIENFK